MREKHGEENPHWQPLGEVKSWPLGDGRYDSNGKFTQTKEDLKARATKQAVVVAGGSEEVALAALDAVYDGKDIAAAVLKKSGTQDQAQAAVNTARTF